MAKRHLRDPKREAFWRGVLARFDASGLSVRRFCARERVTEPSFYAWRRVLRERDTEARWKSPAFVPVVVGDEASAGAGGGVVIELSGAPDARALTLRLPPAMPMRQVAELVHAIAAAPVTSGEVHS